MSDPFCQRLPTSGETVVIDGLVSSPALNGKRGQITRYDKDTHRYRVKLRLDDGSQKVLLVKPANISLLPSKKTDIGSKIRGNDAFYYCGDWDITHVLVPCHLETRRRYEQFRQCGRSLIHQMGNCRIFVSVSGPAELRELAMDSLRFAAAIPEHGLGRAHQWIVLMDEPDSEYTRKAQFQHYQSMLSVSTAIKPSAWLMFLDNDDMYHPFRVRYFQDLIAERAQEDHMVENIFFCGGKLLIDVERANARFGDGDFDVIPWDKFVSKDEELNGLVDVAASAREVAEKDVQEYFDFCVKGEILQRFIDATPERILSHRFCDVRFTASLSNPRVKCYTCPHEEWLLMHYRVRSYDRGERFRALDLETHTNAMLRVEVSDDDQQLEDITGIEATKIAFHRRDFEEKAIECVHRDEENVVYLRNLRVPQLNELYGNDIGTMLWDQTMAKYESYFTPEQAEKSKEWWRGCGIPPPPVGGDVEDDEAKYW